MTPALPRVTYTNVGEDLAPVHAHLDTLIPEVEARLLGRVHAAFVGGRDRAEGELATLRSPIDTNLVLGHFPSAPAALVEDTIAQARAAFDGWRATPWPARVRILRAGAEVLAERKYEIAVACLLEVGKSRLEAVGEVEEAVDLVRHYTAEMERADGFAATCPPAVANEVSRVAMRPYGVFGVIAPFNFPVALALGMMTAALVAGNTVVFKPGEASALTGRLIVDCLIEAGLPEGVLNLVYGGANTGAALVANARVDGFAFTGSNAVGMGILRSAAAGRAHRPVLAEMGGKNPAFVCASADLDVAAAGVMRSAFGLQGQKCSAGSKVYVARAVLNGFLDRLIPGSERIVVGDPRRAEVFMGPLVNPAALARFEAAIADAHREGRVLLGGERLAGGIFDQGCYVGPTIVAELAPAHRINREELFLPLLSVIAFDDLDHAISDANTSDYGLSAGIYTCERAEIDRFLNTIEAGVLYANRASGATTGAWPGIQTFCGWKGSGTSGKGGLGQWYVPQFLREQSHTLFGNA